MYELRLRQIDHNFQYLPLIRHAPNVCEVRAIIEYWGERPVDEDLAVVAIGMVDGAPAQATTVEVLHTGPNRATLTAQIDFTVPEGEFALEIRIGGRGTPGEADTLVSLGRHRPTVLDSDRAVIDNLLRCRKLFSIPHRFIQIELPGSEYTNVAPHGKLFEEDADPAEDAHVARLMVALLVEACDRLGIARLASWEPAALGHPGLKAHLQWQRNVRPIVGAANRALENRQASSGREATVAMFATELFRASLEPGGNPGIALLGFAAPASPVEVVVDLSAPWDTRSDPVWRAEVAGLLAGNFDVAGEGAVHLPEEPRATGGATDYVECAEKLTRSGYFVDSTPALTNVWLHMTGLSLSEQALFRDPLRRVARRLFDASRRLGGGAIVINLCTPSVVPGLGGLLDSTNGEWTWIDDIPPPGTLPVGARVVIVVPMDTYVRVLERAMAAVRAAGARLLAVVPLVSVRDNYVIGDFPYALHAPILRIVSLARPVRWATFESNPDADFLRGLLL